MGLAATVVDAMLAPSRLTLDLVALLVMALASLELGPSQTRASGRRFAAGYGMIFVGLLLPARLWAVCTLFQNHWGTRDLRA
jgi:protein-S-isoprenylcysteine O-methyltransferase Ste14